MKNDAFLFRDKANGRFAHSTFDAMCRCGHTLGVHAADTVDGLRPCFNGDHPGKSHCDCVKFRKVREVRS